VNDIGELEDENESLTSKLATSEEVVERLEKELAALKKPLLSHLGVW
jgi:archaellum component FlaC